MRGLQRKAGTKEPKAKFILYCEGANTEPHYFKAFRRAHLTAVMEIEIVPASGEPKAITDQAIQRVREIKRRKNSLEGNDQVWAVFDRDEHLHFDNAIARCRSSGVHVARSNPCFEVWLILHEKEYERSCTRHDVQRECECIYPEYDRNSGKSFDFSEIIAGVEAAEARAERQLQARDGEGNPFGPPSTTVHQLTRLMRSSARVG